MSGKEVADRMLKKIDQGKIREHRLVDKGAPRSGEDELIEMQRMREFLPSKNGVMIYNLKGSE